MNAQGVITGQITDPATILRLHQCYVDTAALATAFRKDYIFSQAETSKTLVDIPETSQTLVDRDVPLQSLSKGDVDKKMISKIDLVESQELTDDIVKAGEITIRYQCNRSSLAPRI